MVRYSMKKEERRVFVFCANVCTEKRRAKEVKQDGSYAVASPDRRLCGGRPPRTIAKAWREGKGFSAGGSEAISELTFLYAHATVRSSPMVGAIWKELRSHEEEQESG